MKTTDQEVRLDLASGAWLKILTFSGPSEGSSRWIFDHRYRRRELVGTGDVDVVCDTKAMADYEDGILQSPVVLGMHVIIPRRLGTMFVAGADVSPGAKTYIEFQYERPVETAEIMVLAEIRLGATRRMRLDEAGAEAMARPVQFPFPVLDRLIPDCGKYKLPFLSYGPADRIGDLSVQTTEHFEVPLSLRRVIP